MYYTIMNINEAFQNPSYSIPPFSYTAIAISQISNINKFGCQTWIKILVHDQKYPEFLKLQLTKSFGKNILLFPRICVFTSTSKIDDVRNLGTG